MGGSVRHKQFAYPGYLASAGLALLLVLILLPSGSAQAPSPTSFAKLPRVRMDGTYFERDGKRFLVIGAHWVPAKAAMQWPVQWDPKDIEADFAKKHDLGYNMVRIDMMWAWFEPRPGDYNPEAFRQLDYLISLGRRYKIYIHPSLFLGGDVWRAYWVVWCGA